MLSKRTVTEVSSELGRHAEKISSGVDGLTLAVGLVGVGLLAIALALLVGGGKR